MSNKKNNFELIKKTIAILMVLIWIILIFKIFKSGGTMSDQLPKCIFTTIGVFAILNIIVKIIDYLETKDKNS